MKTDLTSPFSRRLEVRAQVAQAFLAKFQLSSEEMSTLRGARDAPISEVDSFYRLLSEGLARAVGCVEYFRSQTSAVSS